MRRDKQFIREEIRLTCALVQPDLAVLKRFDSKRK